MLCLGFVERSINCFDPVDSHENLLFRSFQQSLEMRLFPPKTQFVSVDFRKGPAQKQKRGTAGPAFK
jgi:hypothetical protein